MKTSKEMIEEAKRSLKERPEKRERKMWEDMATTNVTTEASYESFVLGLQARKMI